MNRLAVFLIVSLIFFRDLSLGQTPSISVDSSQPPPAASPPVMSATPDPAQQELRNEVIRLREKVESVSGTTNLLVTILATVLALGGLTSLFSWARNEFAAFKRADEKVANERASQIHTLGIRGETASQARSEEVHQTFLAGSKNTLDLVNATLTLAKEASERAAKSVEARARTMLQELDKEAKDLIASVPSQDDRALVADPNRTAILRSLAQRIEGFQINRLVLPEEFRLSPPCMFIRGMDFHLKQQYQDAFAAWKDVVFRDDTPPQLKSLAWYWMGYEHNNLREFDDACRSFERALESAVGARTLELQRMELESRFFKKDSPTPLIETLIHLTESPRQGSEEDLEAVKKRIFGTIGNIYLATGNELRKQRDFTKARENYAKAKEYFQRAAQDDKWALFGLAEAVYWLGDPDAPRMFKEDVRPKAIDEEIRRIEPRTKVLARTTELICCIRSPDLHNEVHSIYSQVTEALGRVEERLTVYSQVQRRNVTKTEFRVDLHDLISEFENKETPEWLRIIG